MEQIKVCTRCVMNDSSDKSIVFNEKGQCNYCENAYKIKGDVYFPNQEGEKKLNALLKEIRSNRLNDYDCLMGISGGLDSSYLAYLGAVKWKLKIIAIHIDDGFDTEISKENIEKVCSSSGIKLINIKPDTNQFNNLIKAYLYAGVPNIAAPQDNILFAYLYEFARKNKIKYFLSGGNFSLESILQQGNTYDAADSTNIKSIYKRYGKDSINKLKFLSKMQRYLDAKIFRIKTIRPLNYINYSKEEAFKELNDFCGFEYYGSKHLENYLTAFIQLYWMPNKFKVDKRTSHLSSLIVSNQMTRDQALDELKKPLYSDEYLEKLINTILTKLNLTKEELNLIMNGPNRQHTDFKTDRFAKIVKRILK